MSIRLRNLTDMQSHIKSALDYLEKIEVIARANSVIPGQATAIDQMRRTLHEQLQSANELWQDVLYEYTDAIDIARHIEEEASD